MSLFIPDLICETIYDIPISFFDKRGIKHLFLDIDNTLVSYNTPKPTKKNLAWFAMLEKCGIKIYFVSNNSSLRVKSFAEGIDAECIPDAHKPIPKAYNELIRSHGLSKKSIAAVGDQIFTDVLAARLAGLGAAVVVTPVEKVENTFFRFKRACEVPFIKRYYRKYAKEKCGK